jgi:hypothetical protein
MIAEHHMHSLAAAGWPAVIQTVNGSADYDAIPVEDG